MLTQPITLITGTPGGGKTLRALYEGIQLAKAGRKVFFYGFDGFSPDKIQEFFGVDTYILPDDWFLEKWQELPSGSVLFVDEAHKFLPVRQPGKPPQWIQNLTEIRHYGIQLVLITQDPRNIDSFVRRLIGEHLHLSRKAGLAGAMVRTFQGVAENTDDYTARQSSSQAPWLYDKKLYECYKSASLHVIKPKLPKKIIFALILGVAILIAIPFFIYKFKNNLNKNTTITQKENTSLLNTGENTNSLQQSENVAWSSPQEFVKAHTALIPTAPWSAPIYKGLTPASVPRIFCIASGLEGEKDRTCNCYTEQITKIKNIPKLICEQAVKEGIYNPYIPPLNNVNTTSQEPASLGAVPASSSVIIPSDSSKNISSGAEREFERSGT